MKKRFTRALIFILVVPAAHITLAIVAIFELERGRTATVSPWWVTINHITAFPSFYTDLANCANPSVGWLLFVNAAIFSALCFLSWKAVQVAIDAFRGRSHSSRA